MHLGNRKALRPFTEIVPANRVSLSFSAERQAAQIEFVDSPNGVRVRVVFDGEPTHSVEQQREGWQTILNNFTRYVEASR